MNRRGIRRAILENLVLDALRKELMHPDLVQEFVAAFHEEVNRLARTRTQDRTWLEKELAEVSRKLDGLIDAIADGMRTPGILARLQELESRKVKLEADLTAEPPSTVRIHPKLADLYREKWRTSRLPFKTRGCAMKPSGSSAASLKPLSCTRTGRASRSRFGARLPGWWRLQTRKPPLVGRLFAMLSKVR